MSTVSRWNWNLEVLVHWNLEVLVFMEGGKPENPKPTDAGSGIRTRGTLVGGEPSNCSPKLESLRK